MRPYLEFLPPIIARRGASRRAPENTLAAFTAAREIGVKWIGTNVKLTSDGIPVLIYDENLDRTTDGHGAVSDMAWPEMQKLDSGSWFSPEFKSLHVPTLAQALDFAVKNNIRLELELRPGPGRTQATAMIALIEVVKARHDPQAPPLISSFDVETLEVAYHMHPDLPRALFLDPWREDWRELATRTQASAIGIDERLLTPERLQIIHATSVPLLAYTVNDPQRAGDLLASGVTAILTDLPSEIIKAL